MAHRTSLNIFFGKNICLVIYFLVIFSYEKKTIVIFFNTFFFFKTPGHKL